MTTPAVDEVQHHHTQVLLEVNGQRATVDEGMVPVLRLLWEHGIRTIASCVAPALGSPPAMTLCSLSA